LQIISIFRDNDCSGSKECFSVPLFQGISSSLYDREVILLCAGRQKLRALKGLLKTGFVKGLIIDGDTALSLIEE
jgi:DNA-binding transcriptional regulator LsrR (DeoR family)